MIWEIALTVLGAGCIGGVINALLDNEFRIPHYKEGCNLWDPGILGNIVVGGFAALVFWGLYTPFADAILFRAENSIANPANAVFTVGDLISSLLVGTGGGRILTSELERMCLLKRVTRLEADSKSSEP